MLRTVVRRNSDPEFYLYNGSLQEVNYANCSSGIPRSHALNEENDQNRKHVHKDFANFVVDRVKPVFYKLQEMCYACGESPRFYHRKEKNIYCREFEKRHATLRKKGLEIAE